MSGKPFLWLDQYAAYAMALLSSSSAVYLLSAGEATISPVLILASILFLAHATLASSTRQTIGELEARIEKLERRPDVTE